MQNEKNLKARHFHLNFFHSAEREVSKDLLLLLDFGLKVIEEKEKNILKREFKQIEVNLNLCENEEMRVLNREHRGKDQATDVLSFPLQENIRRGEFEAFEGHVELGDIFVAYGVCARQAKENEIDFEEEFVHLFIHGLLHLCGYDHEEGDDEDRIMRDLEAEIMDQLAQKKSQLPPAP